MMAPILFEDFLTPRECEQVCQAATDELTAALVQYGDNRRYDESIRRGHSTKLEGTLADRLRQYVAHHCGVDIALVETPRILKYGVGDYFRRHHDGRHRRCTYLIWLTDDYEGGETCLHGWEKIYRGRRGDAVRWYNDDRGDHSSQEVTAGEKWVAVIWVRN